MKKSAVIYLVILYSLSQFSCDNCNAQANGKTVFVTLLNGAKIIGKVHSTTDSTLTVTNAGKPRTIRSQDIRNIKTPRKGWTIFGVIYGGLVGLSVGASTDEYYPFEINESGAIAGTFIGAGVGGLIGHNLGKKKHEVYGVPETYKTIKDLYLRPHEQVRTGSNDVSEIANR